MFCNNCGKEFKEALPVCDNCGAPLTAPVSATAEPVTQPTPAEPQTVIPQPVAPPPAPEKPKKGGKKPIIIAVVAVLLVAAIVLGIVFGPGLIEKIKGGNADGDGEKDVAVQSPKSESAQVFDSAMTTLFESENLKIRMENGDDYIEISADFGKDLADSELSWESNIDGVLMKLAISDSKIIIESDEIPNGKGEIPLDSYLSMTNVNDILSSYGIDVKLIDLLDTLINCKIDEGEVGKFYDETIRPMLEEMIEYELDVTTTLPTFDKMITFAGGFFDKGVSKEALSFTAVESDEGKTYEIKYDVAQLINDLGEYAKTDAEAKKLLQTVVDNSDGEFADIDELVSAVADEFEGMEDELSLKVSIKDGRLTGIEFTSDYDGTTKVIITSN